MIVNLLFLGFVLLPSSIALKTSNNGICCFGLCQLWLQLYSNNKTCSVSSTRSSQMCGLGLQKCQFQIPRSSQMCYLGLQKCQFQIPRSSQISIVNVYKNILSVRSSRTMFIKKMFLKNLKIYKNTTRSQ